MAQKDLIDQITLIKNELKNLDVIYKEKENEAKTLIKKEYKSNYKDVEVKLATNRKELKNITAKIDKDRKRTNHMDLSDLKMKQKLLKIEIKKETNNLKEINKFCNTTIDKKIKELQNEKEKKRKNTLTTYKRLIKEYEILKKPN
ncbi:MAG: hypothetical protein JXA99_10675 [Candidatus Lokiarchaeota archaeon]|nr:hypothetical protein [Candidatus Lokiarchaeota archaeon]